VYSPLTLPPDGGDYQVNASAGGLHNWAQHNEKRQKSPSLSEWNDSSNLQPTA